MKNKNEMKVRTIEVRELRETLGAGGIPLLIDVRTPSEFASSRIPGAVSMPLDGLDAAELRKALQGRTGGVLICQHGARALLAMETLEESGLHELVVLNGGMAAWKKAGYSVVGSSRGDMKIGTRIIFGLLSLGALALGRWVDPAFYGFAVFTLLGLIAGGLPCCSGRPGSGGGCCGGSSCGR